MIMVIIIYQDDVEVKDVSDDITALGVAGPETREVLAAAGFMIPEMQVLQIQPVSWKGMDCSLVCGAS